MIFKSVYRLEIGAPGAYGAMGDYLVNYRPKLVSQGINFNFPKGTVIKEYSDGADVPEIAIPGRPEGATLGFKLSDLSVENLVALLGGTASGTKPYTYSHSGVRKSNYVSCRIIADMFGGKQFCMEIPYCLLTAGIVGSPTADATGKAELDCQLEFITPSDASGNPLTPFKAFDLLDATVLTATASALSSATGTTTITLSSAIGTLAAGDIKVYKNGVLQTITTHYTVATPTTTPAITFTAGAGLVNTDKIEIVITKATYVINLKTPILITMGF